MRRGQHFQYVVIDTPPANYGYTYGYGYAYEYRRSTNGNGKLLSEVTPAMTSAQPR